MVWLAGEQDQIGSPSCSWLRPLLRPPAATQLVGGSGEWRARTGDYRIVYDIEDDRLVVLVLRMAHRREVYRAR